MPIHVRKAGDRGYFNYEGFKTYHTFSFGHYYDSSYNGFRSLKVLNEDYVQPGVGFPLHANQNMEIFSIVVEGGLAHQDNMGNGSILRPGSIQLLSTGRGVVHSEYNASDKEELHLMQVWIQPDTKNLEPSYQETSFSDSTQHNQWCLIMSPDGNQNSLKIHQDVRVYLSKLDPDTHLTMDLADQRFGWLHVIKGQILLNEEFLEAGDGASISLLPHFRIQAKEPSYLMFLDLN